MIRHPLSSGFASSTISRLELKPPVTTTTALLRISVTAPVLRVDGADPGDAPPVGQEPVRSGAGEDLRRGVRRHRADQRLHQPEAVAVRAMPAMDTVAFLELQVHPLGAVLLGPVIEVVQGVLDVVARPHFIDRAPAPRHPVRKRLVRCVDDAQRLLQRRADEEASPAGGRRGAAERIVLLQQDRPGARRLGLQCRRDPGAAAPDDRDIRVDVTLAHGRSLVRRTMEDESVGRTPTGGVRRSRLQGMRGGARGSRRGVLARTLSRLPRAPTKQMGLISACRE